MKTKYIFLFPLLLLILAQVTFAQPKTKDILEFDSIKINGEIPLVTRKDKVIKLLGKPSKIVKVNQNTCISYYFTETLFAENYIYYGKTKFESYGDTLVLTKMDFESTLNLFLKHPKILFNHDTTLKEFLKKFPSAISPSEKERGEILYQISPSKNSSDFWYLYFKNGKLVRIEYWMPC